jgi:hypothetical protein
MVKMVVGKLAALAQTGLAILLVEQNVHLALALSSYAYVIAEGRPFAKDRARASPRCRRSGRRIWVCSLQLVGWVELIRAFTPVFAGYAKPIGGDDGYRKSSTYPTQDTNVGA